MSNIKIYIYDENNKYLYSLLSDIDTVMSSLIDNQDFTLTPPPNNKDVWRWVDTEWIADAPFQKPIEDLQSIVWLDIKSKRTSVIDSGVSVDSVDKIFQTDSSSIAQYSSIAGMIAIDNYEPIEWKTKDNTYVLLTVELFKELQRAISNNTQKAFTTAEYHKAEMLKADNPLEYDYSDKWV